MVAVVASDGTVEYLVKYFFVIFLVGMNCCDFTCIIVLNFEL